MDPSDRLAEFLGHKPVKSKSKIKSRKKRKIRSKSRSKIDL